MTIINTTNAIAKITNALTMSGLTGAALTLDLTANFVVEDWVISGANFELLGSSTLSVIDVSAPGSWSCVIEGFGRDNSLVARGTVVATVSGAPSMGQVEQPSVTNTTTTAISLSWPALTAPVAAASYEVRVNQNDNNIGDAGTGTTTTVDTLIQDTNYIFEIRGVSAGGLRGPWSLPVTGKTLKVGGPGPDPGQTPVRMFELQNATMVQMYLKNAGNDPHAAFRGAIPGAGGAYTTAGWIDGYWKALTQVGIRRIRSSVLGTGGQSRTIIEKLYDPEYGPTRIDVTMVQARVEGTGSNCAETLTYIRQNYPKGAVYSIQGLNEPNSRTNFADKNWHKQVHEQAQVIWDNVNPYRGAGGFFEGVTIGTFSTWKRAADDVRDLIWANFQNGKPSGLRTVSTFYGNRTIADLMALCDWTNIHCYNSGRPPEVYGKTGFNTSEGGNAGEQSIDDVIQLHKEYRGHTLSNDPKYPFDVNEECRVTENGWCVYDDVNPRGEAFLSEEAAAKYFIRSMFAFFVRGVKDCSWFEFLDNQNQPTKTYGMLDWTYSQANGYTWIPRVAYFLAYYTWKAWFDGGVNAATFTPLNNLDFTLGNQPGNPGQYDADVRHILCQKSNGRWVIVVWLETVSWNQDGPRSNNSFSSRPIRLTINEAAKTIRHTRPFAQAVLKQMPLQATNWTSAGSTNVLDFTVHDDPYIIELT